MFTAELLVQLLILLVIVVVVHLIVARFVPDSTVRMIIYIVLGIVVVIWLLRTFGLMV